MTRPTVARADIEGALAQYRLSLAEHPVITLGLRGAFGEKNTIGGFDDALVIYTSEFCEAFTGNTDPSSEIEGRANLVTGIHWFKPGKHHRGTPKEYDAFVQDGPIVVMRWQTEEVAPQTKHPTRGLCLGAGLWKGEFGINIHNAMGVNTTGSEGCQTVIKPEWAAYHTLLSDELRKAGVRRFPYLLVEGVKAERAKRATA